MLNITGRSIAKGVSDDEAVSRGTAAAPRLRRDLVLILGAGLACLAALLLTALPAAAGGKRQRSLGAGAALSPALDTKLSGSAPTRSRSRSAPTADRSMSATRPGRGSRGSRATAPVGSSR
jgi:hypothetical protein